MHISKQNLKENIYKCIFFVIAQLAQIKTKQLVLNNYFSKYEVQFLNLE